MPDNEQVTPEQMLTAVVNAGGDIVGACYLYIAQASTWNLASVIAESQQT